VSGVFDHRPDGRGAYEIRIDGVGEISILFSGTRIKNAPLLIRQITALVARVEKGTLAPGAGPLPMQPNWQRLGWKNRREHDEQLARLNRARALWSRDRRAAALDAYVDAERARFRIGDRPPFAKPELTALESIIERAPRVVDQELAAERGGA
jgi:hypothetical protein